MNYTWLIWSIVAAISLSCYNTLFRLASTSNIFIYLMIANVVAFSGYFIASRFIQQQANMTFEPVSGKIILLGITTGFVIVVIEFAIYFMLRGNQSGLSLGFPIMNIVTLLLTFAVGLLFFKEKIIWQNGLGIVFGLLAVWLLAYKKA